VLTCGCETRKLSKKEEPFGNEHLAKNIWSGEREWNVDSAIK
jgi:hypothetical protein